MNFTKLMLLIHTIKYLKFKQIYYRLYYLFRNKFFKSETVVLLKNEVLPIKWVDYVYNTNSYNNNNTFLFLNISHQFSNKMDWDYSSYGRLWTYNLNYFEFLNQQNITKIEGLLLIEDYLSNYSTLKVGLESYPISLRGINWIKFLSKHSISNSNINQQLYNQYQVLLKNIEYELLGNHLLENAFSLLFGAYYFKDLELYKKAKNILTEELEEQVLTDGAHFELSPMYHQIILYRCLESINVVNENKWIVDDFRIFIAKKAIKMLAWLEAVTFKNGDVPMVNDSAFNIAPSSKELFEYAQKLELKWASINLFDSGYRAICKKNYEIFIDVGHVGPTYIPGHAHSDTFNFLVNLNNKPFITEVGTSTYEKNNLRQIERSTVSHNTVKVNNVDQTQVWGGFRVAKRAKIIKLVETEEKIIAVHNGYNKFEILHEREFLTLENRICIVDHLISKKSKIQAEAYIHFHPEVSDFNVTNNTIIFKDFGCKITFSGEDVLIRKERYKFALGFNSLVEAQMVKIIFNKLLKTEIEL